MMNYHKTMIGFLAICAMLVAPLYTFAAPQVTQMPSLSIHSDAVKPAGEYEIYVLKDNEWKQAGELSFDKYFRSEEIDLGKYISGDENFRIRLVQKGGGAAHIDAVLLGSNPPAKVNGTDDILALKKVSKKDFDVVDAFQKDMEFVFPSNESKVLNLTARVEGTRISEIPFQFPLSNLFKKIDGNSEFYRYSLVTEEGVPVKTGRQDMSENPLFKEYSVTGSGHPSGFTYGWIRNDDKNLYVTMDFTPDDTMDGSKDYAKVYVKTGDEIREFKVSVPETEWGNPDFTYTDKVAYQHKVYDFTIPFKEIGVKDAKKEKNLLLAFAAYGTATPELEISKTGDTLSKVGDDVNYQITIRNTGVDILWKQSIVDTLLGDLSGEPGCDASLDPGESCDISVSRTVQPGDPDPLPNTVTAVYDTEPDFTGAEISVTTSHSVNLFQPSIAVAKTGDTLSKVGDDVTYTIALLNSSSEDTPALNCTVTDSLLGDVFNGVLLPGDTVINATRTVQEGDPDPLDNIVTMTCFVEGFPNVLEATASHSVNLFQPAVEVIKTGPATATVGESITYQFTINNLSSGDSPDLILSSVTDTVLGDLTAAATAAGCGTLDSGGTCIFTFDYTIQAGDPNPLVNVVTASYNPDGFQNVITDDDEHTLTVKTLNAICRTTGFWETHAGTECPKKQPDCGSKNITQAVISNECDEPCLEICGESITNTDLGSGNSALEAMCVAPRGNERLQLASQLTATSLNCCTSVREADCEGLDVWNDLFNYCNSVCTLNLSDSFSYCIQALDCLNKGGKPFTISEDPLTIFCQTGTCVPSDGDTIIPLNNNLTLACNEDTACLVKIDGIVDENLDGIVCKKLEEVCTECVPFEETCHTRLLGVCADGSICTEENTTDSCANGDSCDAENPCKDGSVCKPLCDSDGSVCKPGPAGSSDACTTAIGDGKSKKAGNDCAILPKASGDDCSKLNQGEECCESDSEAVCEECEHDLCETGLGLDLFCDTCVTEVCFKDPSCCNDETGEWNSQCVSEAAELCGISCNNPPSDEDELFTVEESASDVLLGNKLANAVDPDGDILFMASIDSIALDTSGVIDAGLKLPNLVAVIVDSVFNDGDGAEIDISTDLGTAKITIEENGDESFSNPDNIFDPLVDGEILIIKVGYTITDGQATDSSQQEIEITGQNDAPIPD